MKTRLLVVAALTATVYGCKCTPQVSKNQPDYVPTPTALNFEACPTKDEGGMPVKDVFPDQQKVNVRNDGKAGGGLKLSFTGDGAALFSVAAMPVPTAIDALANIDLPINFSPTAKGVVKAQLLISDETDNTPDQKVDLVGTGSDLAGQPTLVVSTLDVTGKYNDCLMGLVCEQDFNDTLFKEASSLEVKITNTGCPGLKLTGIEIIPYASGGGNLAYFLDVPATPPSIDAPIVLTQSESRQTTKFTLRFAPEDDGSGNLQRFATLRIKTNDPNARDGDNNVGGFDVLLSGSALQPSIYSTPSRCDFSDPTDLCGNAAKVANQANFLIKNGGNVAIKIDSTTFKSNSSQTSNKDGRFTIGAPIVGMTIPAGGSVPLQLTHAEMPLYVTDLLTVSASVGPAFMPGSAGRAIISLAGGKKPCLSTVPAIDTTSGQAVLDFSNPATALSAKTVTIKNGPAATCGDLIINAVTIDPNPFFTLIDPQVAPGSKIIPGGSLDATVQYKKPVSGGLQVGTFRIDSNDGDFSSPPGYVVQLFSQSPVDEVPVAVLKGCLPSDTTCALGKSGSMSVQLSTLPMGPTNGTRLLTMWGKDSYDPPSNTMVLSNYQFRLVSKPSNATNASLENDGLKNPKGAVTLTLDGAATGLYRVTLTVFDDKDQASGAAAELKLNVTQ